MSAAALRALARDAVVVLDEVHHAGDEQAWGESSAARVRRARAPPVACPARRSARHARHPVRALRGRRGRARLRVRLRRRAARRPRRAPGLLPADRWRDGVERARTAPSTRPRSTTRSRRQLANQRLRTALSLDGRVAAHRAAQARRAADRGPPRRSPTQAAWSSPSTRTMPGASPTLLRTRFGAGDRWSPPTIRRRRTGSPAFATGRDPWLVAVRMVCEGVDIPRLRSASTRPRPPPTCSSARRSAGSCAGYAGVARPAGVAVHPRRPPAAHPCGPDRGRSAATRCAGTPATTTRVSIRRSRPGRSTRAPSSCRCSRRCRPISTGEADGLSPWQEALPDDWEAPAIRASWSTSHRRRSWPRRSPRSSPD